MEANPRTIETTAPPVAGAGPDPAAASGWEAQLRNALGECCEAKVDALAQDGMRLCCTEKAARRLLAATAGTEALVNAQFDLPLGHGAARVSVALRLAEARCRHDGSWELTSEFLALRPRARRLLAAYFALEVRASGVQVGNQQAA